MKNQAYSVIVAAQMPVLAYSGVKDMRVAEITVALCDSELDYQKKVLYFEMHLKFILTDFANEVENYGTVYEFVKMVKSNPATENAEFSVYVKFN